MTTEQKAKAYDEALEKAKKLQKTCDSQAVVGWCEYLFPELRESEDERIRKDIVFYIAANHKDDGEKARWLYWLEKQGQEPKKVSIWKHWKDGIAGNGEGEQIYLIKYGNTYHLSSCLSFECDYIELSELDNFMLEKQGEPSIKWNKNTEGNKPQVNHSVLMKTTHGIAEGEWQGEQWYQYRWSSSVKDSDVLSWIELSDLEKKGEQKPFDYECADKSKEQSLSFQIQAYLNTASDELFAKGKPLYSEERLEEIHKCMLMWQTLHNAYFYRKPAWSEKDESHCQMLQKIICDSSASASLANKLSDWLNSIKQRIGG